MAQMGRVRLHVVVLMSALAGCAGSGDDASAPIAVHFTTPTAGESFTRGQIEAATGELVADVDVALAIDGAPARVAISLADREVADADADGHAVVPVGFAGTVTLVATAYDATGAAAATDLVAITVDDPVIADCHGWLDLYGVAYTAGPASDGVVDPVTATVPINGLGFRYIENTTPRSTLFADCDLILSLAKAAPLFRARGVTEIADYGVYNYRCIGTGTPPDCPQGMSQHAYAMAIDLAGFTLTDGTYTTVLDDWVIDPPDEATCAAATEPGLDAFLHEMICAAKDAGLWNIVLTPNYNADHRNHFHVDLTPDADFMRGRGTVDRGPDNH